MIVYNIAIATKIEILSNKRVFSAFEFSDVGVDFTGPIYLKNCNCYNTGQRKEKKVFYLI